MKLFLSSLAIPNKQEYAKLFGGIRSPKLAVIANAWGTYDNEKSKPYIDAILSLFKDMEITASRINLLDYTNNPKGLDNLLNDFDGVWITGGNSYYLNWCVRQSGFDKIIRKHCERGLVYGGESAGAIIAGPTLDYFQSMDNPNDAPELILDGLRLTNIVVIPHADNVKYKKVLKSIELSLSDDGFNTMTIADNEAIIVSNNKAQKITGAQQ